MKAKPLAVDRRGSELARLVRVAVLSDATKWRDDLRYAQWLRQVLVCVNAGRCLWPARQLVMRLRRECRYTRAQRRRHLSWKECHNES